MNTGILSSFTKILNHNYSRFILPLNFKIYKLTDTFLQFEILHHIKINIEHLENWIVYVEGHQNPLAFLEIIKEEINEESDLISIINRNL